MLKGENRVLYVGYGGKHDIKMNMVDYLDLVSDVKQEQLSADGMLKFKWLSHCNHNLSLIHFATSAVLGYASGRLLLLPVDLGHASYKLRTVIFIAVFPFFFIGMSLRPVPRRLYTELLTDPGDDGAHIRGALREHKPGLWRYLSAQLLAQGHRLPEMDLPDAAHFPKAML